MLMTASEQKEMLDLIKECQDLSAEKTNLMQEIVETAKAVAAENAVLRSENERLKRHLALAEGQIMRMKAEK